MRNAAKSKSPPAAEKHNQEFTPMREAIDGGDKVNATKKMQDGTAINYSSSIKYAGEEYPAIQDVTRTFG